MIPVFMIIPVTWWSVDKMSTLMSECYNTDPGDQVTFYGNHKFTV